MVVTVSVLALVLLIVGLVILLMAAFGIGEPSRVRLGWLGLSFWLLAEIILRFPQLR